MRYLRPPAARRAGVASGDRDRCRGRARSARQPFRRDGAIAGKPAGTGHTPRTSCVKSPLRPWTPGLSLVRRPRHRTDPCHRRPVEIKRVSIAPVAERTGRTCRQLVLRNTIDYGAFAAAHGPRRVSASFAGVSGFGARVPAFVRPSRRRSRADAELHALPSRLMAERESSAVPLIAEMLRTCARYR